MILIRLPDGRITAVEEADVAGAVEAGAEVVDKAVKTKFGRESTAQAAGPDLGGYIDPVEEQAAAIQAERRRSYEDEGLTAFGQGAVRSLTAGLIPFDSEESRLREEVNPYATVAGEVGGLVGGGLLGAGAPGLAAKAGAAAAGGIKSTVGRFAAEAAVDGLTYSTMREGIGAVVHDKPFSVEAIAAETLLSGGVGAALGAGVKGAGALRKALSKDDVAREAVKLASPEQVAAMPHDMDGAFSAPGLAEPKPSLFQVAEGPSEVVGRKVYLDPAPQQFASPKAFYRDMPHMKVADKDFRDIWKELDDLDDAMVAIPGDSPLFAAPRETWASLQAAKRDLASTMGFRRVKGEARAKATERGIRSSDVPEDAWSSFMDPRSATRNQKAIDKYAEVLQLAKKLDTEVEEIRQLRGQYHHADLSVDLTGGSSRLTGALTKEERDSLVAARRKAYAAEMGDRARSDADEFISEVLGRDMGTLTEKLPYKKTGTANLKQFKDLPEFKRDMGGAEPGEIAPWDRTNARPVEIINKSIKAGEPPHIEELLMLPKADRQAVMSSLKQKHIDSLGAEIANNPKIIRVELQPSKIDGPALRARKSMDELRADMKAQELAPQQFPAAKKGKKIQAEPAPSVKTDGLPEAPATGSGFADMLSRTNVMGMMMAGMFPKLAMAKAVISTYGAKLAGAAERAMSNRAVQMVARKAPVIAWAKIMAPEGQDRDRNLRAVKAISQSPEAWDAAVDEALANINPDSPTQRIEARERIQAQLGYLVQNAPSSLSPLRDVWSPSSIAHFNRLIDAWQDPLGVLANVKTAPTEQLNAVREMWPESYNEFMAKLVDQVSTYAAEGKPIPRDIGRILPMASASWSVGGMQTLQSMQTQPVEMDQSGKFNSQTAAPTTVSESLSSNRINLNR